MATPITIGTILQNPDPKGNGDMFKVKNIVLYASDRAYAPMIMIEYCALDDEKQERGQWRKGLPAFLEITDG